MRTPRQLLRLMVLLLYVCVQSCSPSDYPEVVVNVSGVSSEVKTLSVKTSLNGRPSTSALPALSDGLDRFVLKLPSETVGTLGIRVGAQGQDGCTFLAGDTSVEITGPGSQQAEISLSDTQGCLLIVRKIGDGSGDVAISDGTLLSFSSPDPPAAECPTESLVTSSEQRAYPLDSELEVRVAIPLDATPGSYLSALRGCTAGATGCQVRIGPDTTVIEVQLDRNVVCSPDQVCWEHPLPQGAALERIDGQNGSDIWAVGDSMLLHWEGTYWSAPRHPHIHQHLRGLVTGPNNTMVAVGESGTILRLINNVWSCPESLGSVHLNDAWGMMPSDLWVVGSQGTLQHYVDGVWQAVTIPTLSGVELLRIYGISKSEIWAVGEKGTVLHYDGSAWTQVPFPSTETLYGLWESNKKEVWIVGDHGLSAKIVNNQVTLIPTGTSSRLRAIYAKSEPERWAVGDGGIVLRFDGSTWSQAESGTREDLNALFGTRDTDLWAVGTAGTLLRYNGVFWTPASVSRSSQTLLGIAGTRSSAATSTSSVFAVGEQGTVLRNTGTDWGPDKALGGVFSRTLRAVSTVASSGEVWVVGDGGLVVRWDGTQMQLPITGTSADLQAIWSQPSLVLAVGTGGVLARYGGSSWTSAPLPAAMGRTLRAVFGTAPNSVWIGGDGGTLLFWNGASAAAVPSPVSDAVYGIWGSSPSKLWAVAERGRILRFNGATWSMDAQASALTTQTLRAIAGVSDSLVYAVGDGGVLLRFDGTRWSAIDTGTSRSLSALYVDPAGVVLMVAQGGAIFRYLPTPKK